MSLVENAVHVIYLCLVWPANGAKVPRIRYKPRLKPVRRRVPSHSKTRGYEIAIVQETNDPVQIVLFAISV